MGHELMTRLFAAWSLAGVIALSFPSCVVESKDCSAMACLSGVQLTAVISNAELTHWTVTVCRDGACRDVKLSSITTHAESDGLACQVKPFDPDLKLEIFDLPEEPKNGEHWSVQVVDDDSGAVLLEREFVAEYQFSVLDNGDCQDRCFRMNREL